jgi:hypothetical protein
VIKYVGDTDAPLRRAILASTGMRQVEERSPFCHYLLHLKDTVCPPNFPMLSLSLEVTPLQF